jgi:hypothetical protein
MRKLLFLMLFVFVLSCQHDLSYDMEMMANAPEVGPPGCKHAEQSAYNLTIGNWQYLDELTWSVSNTPAGWTHCQIVGVVCQAFSHWDKHIPLTITYTDDTLSSQINIKFDYIDGIGGQLGSSEYPPAPSSIRKRVQVVIDKYDVQPLTSDGDPAYDFFTIILHELGHALGLKHSEDPEAVMFSNYSLKKKSLARDDAIGIRSQYGNLTSFELNGHNYIWINSDDPTRITPNFLRNEFFSKCQSGNITGHYLDSALVVCAQFLRDYYKQPIRIISTYRNPECNHHAGGASRSQHLFHSAIDFKFVGNGWYSVHKRYHSDIISRKPVMNALVSRGIKGFGGYPSSNHIDTRRSGTLFFGSSRISTWGTLNPHALTVLEDDINEYREINLN